jgi:hypothetical protein
MQKVNLSFVLEQEIERARQYPGFELEYNLKFLGNIGNVFSLHKIEQCINLGELYKSLPINQYTIHSYGV